MEPDEWEIECDRGGGTTVEFSVRIPEDDVNETKKQSLNELKQEVDEPGFRQGKVPDSIIEKKYDPQLKQNMLEKLIPNACEVVYRRYDIRPVDRPSVQDFDINGEFYMEATVEEQPQIEIDPEQYRGIELEETEQEHDEDAVEEQLEQLLENSSSLEGIEEDRAVETGDFVKIDLEGRDESGELIQGTQSEETVVEIGSKRFLPEIEQGIVGSSPGDQLEIDAEFPDDFVDDSLAGENVTFDVNVLEIQEQSKPEVDDPEFLEEMGVESTDELREKIREQIQQAGEQEGQRQQGEQVYEHLLENIEFDLPDVLVEQEIDSILEQQKQQLQQQNRDFEEYLEEQDLTEEELREEAEPEAERRIRLTLIFQAIAEEEDIEVSEEEFNERLDEIASQYGVSVEDLRDNFPPQQLQNIRYEQRDQKVLDYLIEQADINTVAPDPDETEAEEE